MASYKLTYLNYRGRAELIRFILSQAGLQFEDCRLPPEKWQETRPSKLLQFCKDPIIIARRHACSIYKQLCMPVKSLTLIRVHTHTPAHYCSYASGCATYPGV